MSNKKNYGSIGSPIDAMRQNNKDIDNVLTLAFGESDATKTKRAKAEAAKAMSATIQKIELEVGGY